MKNPTLLFSLCLAVCLSTAMAKDSDDKKKWAEMPGDYFKSASKVTSKYDDNQTGMAPTDVAKAGLIASGAFLVKAAAEDRNLENWKNWVSANKGTVATGVLTTALVYSKWLEAGLRYVPWVGDWAADRICDNKDCTGACHRCQFTKGALAVVVTGLVGPTINKYVQGSGDQGGNAGGQG